LSPDRLNPARLDGANLSDVSKVAAVALFFARANRAAVAATEADRRLARGSDRRNQPFVHHAGEHHQRHVARFGVGDAQAVDEFAFLAEPLHRAGEFHAAAVDDRDLVAVARQLNNGVRALAQDFRIVERGSSDLDDDPHCNPSASFHPYITFMFCTACPAAPLSRLSMQETITRRRPSSARQKPISQKFEYNEY
jgi:hypothetical protein